MTGGEGLNRTKKILKELKLSKWSFFRHIKKWKEPRKTKKNFKKFLVLIASLYFFIMSQAWLFLSILYNSQKTRCWSWLWSILAVQSTLSGKLMVFGLSYGFLSKDRCTSYLSLSYSRKCYTWGAYMREQCLIEINHIFFTHIYNNFK